MAFCNKEVNLFSGRITAFLDGAEDLRQALALQQRMLVWLSLLHDSNSAAACAAAWVPRVMRQVRELQTAHSTLMRFEQRAHVSTTKPFSL